MTKSSNQRVIRRSVEAQTQYEMKKTFEAVTQMALRALFFHALYTAISPSVVDEFVAAVEARFRESMTTEEGEKGLRPNETFERARKAAVEVSQEWAASGKEVFT